MHGDKQKAAYWRTKQVVLQLLGETPLTMAPTLRHIWNKQSSLRAFQDPTKTDADALNPEPMNS